MAGRGLPIRDDVPASGLRRLARRARAARALRVPRNVTLVPLPPCAPRPNPVERAWLYLRERHPGRRLLGGYGAIVDALCRAWNQPGAGRLRRLTSHPHLEQVNC